MKWSPACASSSWEALRIQAEGATGCFPLPTRFRIASFFLSLDFEASKTTTAKRKRPPSFCRGAPSVEIRECNCAVSRLCSNTRCCLRCSREPGFSTPLDLICPLWGFGAKSGQSAARSVLIPVTTLLAKLTEVEATARGSAHDSVKKIFSFSVGDLLDFTFLVMRGGKGEVYASPRTGTG